MVLAAIAVLLVGAQLAMAWLSPAWSHASFRTLTDALPVVLLLGVPAAIGLAATPMLGRREAGWLGLALVIAVGLAMRLVWYGVPIAIDDDYFRYLWDGAVLAAGHNPYAFPPKAAIEGTGLSAALAPLAERARDVLAGVNFPELTTIYPGTAQLAFLVASWIAPLDLDGLRLTFLLAELVATGLLVAVLRDLGRPPVLAALYWANPLVVWSSHGTIHSEALLAPLLLGTCLAAWRGRAMLSALLLALAIGVKLWPVLLAPVLAHTVRARGGRLLAPAVLLALAVAVLLGPLAISAMAGSRSGLVAYSEHWWINNGPFSWISYWVYHLTGGAPSGQRALRATIALTVGGLALWLARRPAAGLGDLLTSATIIAAATFYFAPAQFPWYALWFLPLAAAIGSRPLLLASATLATYYLVQPLINQGTASMHAYGIAFAHSLPVWLWLGWQALAARRQASGEAPASRRTA